MRKKKEKRNKMLEKVQAMPDEEILANEKWLKFRYGFLTVGCILSVVMVIGLWAALFVYLAT